MATGAFPVPPGQGSRRRFGHAWVFLTIALAAHVADEAVTGFLPEYNRLVRAARARFGWYPMPEFTFDAWLTGLAAALLLLLALAPYAYRGSRALGVMAYIYGLIMFLNGVAHLGASVYLGRWAPGATTAPLLVAGGSWLLFVARGAGRARRPDRL